MYVFKLEGNFAAMFSPRKLSQEGLLLNNAFSYALVDKTHMSTYCKSWLVKSQSVPSLGLSMGPSRAYPNDETVTL